MNRKLIRTTLAEVRERCKRSRRAASSLNRAQNPPPDGAPPAPAGRAEEENSARADQRGELLL